MVLLAATCPLCAFAGPSPCPECALALRPAAPLPPPPGVDRCLALLAFEGAGADLVARVKYRNQRASLPGLGRAMAAQAAAVGGTQASVVTWIPTTSRRIRERGFDHGRLLAGHVARALGVPCRRLLVRDDGPPQTGRSRAERLAGPRLRPVRTVSGRVLAVDDVVTTGATASAAAAELTRAGAAEVWILAAARRSPQGHYGT